MQRPVIFTISATWDDEASVWTGYCDAIPAAADAPTLDGLLTRMSEMALDILPDNHPNVDLECGDRTVILGLVPRIYHADRALNRLA